MMKRLSLFVLASMLCACSSLTGFDALLGANISQQEKRAGQEGVDGSAVLSDIELAERRRLLAGKSSRPSLASLDLMPLSSSLDSQGTSQFKLQDGSGLEPAPNSQANSERAQAQSKIPRLSLEQKRDEYETLLPLIENEQQRRQVAFRLADIKMALAEESMVDGKSEFDAAIAQYQAVLTQHSISDLDAARAVFSAMNNDANSEQALGSSAPTPEALAKANEARALVRKQMDAMYQLTRALDLAGRKQESVDVAMEFLDTYSIERFAPSEQHLELFFRIGEHHFSRQAYAQAAERYSQVLDTHSQVSLQNGTDFYAISAYMLGWSEFKQENYPQALEAFDQMLAYTLVNRNAPDMIANEARRYRPSINDGELVAQSIDEIEGLSKGELRLLKDSLRIMALTFSYQGNGQAILAFYEANTPSGQTAAQYAPYRHLIFEELAQQYLDDDRYNDSANALLSFAQDEPLHPRAVEFYVRHIDAYILGGFSDSVITAKQAFVDTYALQTGVIEQINSPIAQSALLYLRRYLKELAQTEHSIAQNIDALIRKREQAESGSAGSLQNSGASVQAPQSSFAASFTDNGNEESSNNLAKAFAQSSDLELRTLRDEAYNQAIDYYSRFIFSFSQLRPADLSFTPQLMDDLLAQSDGAPEPVTVDPLQSAFARLQQEIAQLRFYSAEAYFAMARYPEAIRAFETYAFEDNSFEDRAFDESAFDESAHISKNAPQAVEAAYAALLAYERMLAPLNEDAIASDEQVSNQAPALSSSQAKTEDLASKQRFSQARFVQSFGEDSRVVAVALSLMQSLFSEQNYAQAMQWASYLIDEASLRFDVSAPQIRSANLVMAHSLFALEKYEQAQGYYRNLLAELSSSLNGATQSAAERAALRQDLEERLAASFYKQGELRLASIALAPSELSQISNPYEMPLSQSQIEVIELALADWQNLMQELPNSNFREAAQFDSATYSAMINKWDEAIGLWRDFATRFPQSALSETIDGQLLFAYQQTGNLLQAGRLLLSQYALFSQARDQGSAQNAASNASEPPSLLFKDVAQARDALFQAAQYFDQASQVSSASKTQARALALDTFRKYAHAYPLPLEQANEARYRMSEFYVESGEDGKRRFWLNKMIEAQQAQARSENSSPSDAGSPRSRYLAAMSAMVFAQDADSAFSNIDLSLPLDKSLSRKQSALSKAIDAYDKVLSFAVAEYSTQANYHLANLYLTLADDLMDSARPAGLSALELSQYELLLEEQAYPFEEQAIDLHETNAKRSHDGIYDTFVKQSFEVLSRTLPARYNKQEKLEALSVDDFE